MKPYYFLFLSLFILILGCSKDEDKDETNPTIDTDYLNAAPNNCDEINIGTSYSYQFVLRDNSILGSYSIEIHINEEDHAHDTETEECTFDHEHEEGEEEEEGEPFTFNEQKSIADIELPEHIATGTIMIPETAKEGEYHFTITAIDKAGNKVIKILTIALVHEE